MLRFLFVFASAALCGNEIDSFLEKEYRGDYLNGEIEIVKDPGQIAAIEELQFQRLLKKGWSEEIAREWARTGIVAEDPYWIWIRDPVLFPGGTAGNYGRLLWKSQLNGPVGVAVMPILDGKIALNLNFRHATRSWEWELPRGARDNEETVEEAASRELKEETGFSLNRLVFLGEMAADSGVMGGIVPIYAGWVGERGEIERNESEAIAGIYSFTFEELEKGLRQGYLEIEPHGKVPLRDSFLTYALFQFKNRQLSME